MNLGGLTASGRQRSKAGKQAANIFPANTTLELATGSSFKARPLFAFLVPLLLSTPRLTTPHCLSLSGGGVDERGVGFCMKSFPPQQTPPPARTHLNPYFFLPDATGCLPSSHHSADRAADNVQSMTPVALYYKALTCQELAALLRWRARGERGRGGANDEVGSSGGGGGGGGGCWEEGAPKGSTLRRLLASMYCCSFIICPWNSNFRSDIPSKAVLAGVHPPSS